jgi:hypothetical protein
MRVYTSDEILADPYITHDAMESGSMRYKLTVDEIGWLGFVSGRYCIADCLNECLSIDDDENYIVDLDIFDMSKALKDDDCQPKAVCLSDDTALQHIFFYNYLDDTDE